MNASSYRKFLLLLLQVILAANYLDGLALGLVLQSVKHDLHLSDSQLGFLSGMAFALFYSVMGLPIARWADRGNRVTIISLTATVWSVMVALCAFATSFMQLLCLRVGVGIGEAGCIPPAHSLIADYFTRAERPRAVSIYMLGNSMAVVIGYLFAGWLNEWYGWRVTFAVLGVFGLVPALIAWMTLREPRKAGWMQRGRGAGAVGEEASTPALAEVGRVLAGNQTFSHLLYAFAVVYFFGNGIAQWQPAFFIRSFGLTTGRLGNWFALIYGVGGLVGTYWGGVLASRFAASNERRQLLWMAIAYVIYGVSAALVYVMPTLTAAFSCMACAAVVGSMTTGPLFSTLQSLIPERMRAISIAIVYFFANLIGLGLGPWVTGILSDHLHAWAGEESLRYALLSLSPGFLWVAWHLWRASRSVMGDLPVQAGRTTGSGG